MTSLELLICILLVSVSAYLSASEIALFSLSRFQLRSMKERLRTGHRKIKRLLGDPGGLLITILVMNEIVNISLSSIVANSVSNFRKAEFGSTGNIPPWAVDTLFGLLATAPIILFLCEVTPKVVAARANQLIATLAIGPLTVIYDAFKPIRFLVKGVVSLIGRWSGNGHEIPESAGAHSESILKESDFLLMVEEGHREGAVHQSELELIKNVFDLDDTTVADVFTPLNQTRTLPVNTTLKAALDAMRGLHYSRIPIISTDRKQIVGVFYSKDLLKAKLNPGLMALTVEAIMRKPLFVSPGIRLNTVFRRLKQQKTHMAVVQEGNGPSLGVITMKDIFDELFEDLFPDSPEVDEEDEKPVKGAAPEDHSGLGRVIR
ncbi:MAG TPA: CNNM domain-containing protein [Bdellovibrionota bacterium]|nr:CNNM domain-containing protein [Bdellovibrionota bacterium]